MRPSVVALDRLRIGTPKHEQIAEGIASEIRRGRLKPGARLPSSRALAKELCVNRGTVNAALAELAAQGWIQTLPARGTFVREQLDLPPRRSQQRRAPTGPRPLGFSLREDPYQLTLARAIPQDQLVLTGGIPDPRLFPNELLARAYRRALRRRGAELLDYGDPRGCLALRKALITMLNEARGLSASESEILVTRGSQHAIWLAAHSLLGPGDRVGVEQFGYPPAWDALRTTGATLVPLPVDDEGVQVEAVERALDAGPLKAIYLTPHHQYPTTVALSEARRLRLLDLSRRQRIALLEDDYAHEFHYEGRPRLPMARADESGQVVYIGTLSKILSPGLRIGFAVAPAPLIERMALARSPMDRQGDQVAEAAVAELIEDGEVARHVRRMRSTYKERCDVLIEALANTLGDHLTFRAPSGGMSLWVKVRGARPEAWASAARQRGVIFRPGSELTLGNDRVPFVRMGFTRLSPPEILRAVSLARTAFHEVRGQTEQTPVRG